MRFIPGGALADNRAVQSALEAHARAQESRGFSSWAVVERENERVIGDVGFGIFEPTGDIELGYTLARDSWGRGYATEAAAVCLAAGLRHLGAPRIVAAVDAENEASMRVAERSNDSYGRILWKLAAATRKRRCSTSRARAGRSCSVSSSLTGSAESREERGIELSAATRSNIISVLHSFFAWAESEDLIEVDPTRKIRRPPKRKPASIGRRSPSSTELRAAALCTSCRRSCSWKASGLRNSEVDVCRWQDLDLVHGRAARSSEGQQLAVGADRTRCARGAPALLPRDLQPDLDDYVFTVEVEQWVSLERARRRKSIQSSQRVSQALWRMVKRVCRRAGIRRVLPSPSSGTGSATASCARATRISRPCRRCYGHSRPDTTQGYTDELSLDEQAEALKRAVGAAGRTSVA